MTTLNKFSLIVFIAVLLPELASAQTAIAAFFASMPDSLIPYMSKNNRLDMIDFKESNMEAKVNNQFDKESSLEVLTQDFLRLHASEALTIEMKLLPAEEDSAVVCVVNTWGTVNDVCESSIKLYDRSWNQLTDLTSHVRDEYISSVSEGASGRDGIGSCDFFLTASLSEQNTDLTVTMRPITPLTSDEKGEKHDFSLISLKWGRGTFKGY